MRVNCIGAMGQSTFDRPSVDYKNINLDTNENIRDVYVFCYCFDIEKKIKTIIGLRIFVIFLFLFETQFNKW